jgi:hypothetical protein
MKIKLNQWQHDAACASSSDIMIYIYFGGTRCIEVKLKKTGKDAQTGYVESQVFFN